MGKSQGCSLLYAVIYGVIAALIPTTVKVRKKLMKLG